MISMLHGMITAGYLMAAMFFLRFWRDTKDRLFALFAGAFAILALQSGALGLGHSPLEEQSYLYLLRLLAYVLIVVAIVDKNRR